MPTPLVHDRTVKRFTQHTVLTDGDDPNQRVALQLIERMHIGLQSKEQDELWLMAETVKQLFLQKLALWEDNPERLLDAILEKVIARFPPEETSFRAQETSLFDQHPDWFRHATRHRPPGWEDEEARMKAAPLCSACGKFRAYPPKVLCQVCEAIG